MVGLGDLPEPGYWSTAMGVSADGSVIVGGANTSSTSIPADAFIWSADRGMRHLQRELSQLYGLNLPGWRLVWAEGISADGQTIAGAGHNAAGRAEGWVAHFHTACMPPQVAASPRSETLCAGGTSTLDVTAIGTPPFSYQWRKDGVTLPGATDRLLLIDRATLNDAGTYDVEVQNACGSQISDAAVLTVWPIGSGDLNLDGTADGRDIGEFIRLLTDGTGPQPGPAACAADLNGDGVLDFEDARLFVQRLAS